jgi:excisionase family DNA binding protein
MAHLGHSGDPATRGLQLSMSNKTENTQKHPIVFPHLVGAAEIAVMTGWTRKHIYDLAKRGQIPHYRVGGSIRFDPTKVMAWLDQHEIAA